MSPDEPDPHARPIREFDEYRDRSPRNVLRCPCGEGCRDGCNFVEYEGDDDADDEE